MNKTASKTGVLSFCLVFLLSTFLPQVGLHRLDVAENLETEALAKIEESYGQVPLVFEQNVGQTDEQVKFLNRAGNTTTYFTPTETVFVRSADIGEEDNEELVSDVLRMSLNGANQQPEVFGIGSTESKSNYLIGSDKENWQTNISSYEKVKYEEVYPGIDMVYYGNNDNLEHDFIVAPGMDPNQISFNLNGAKKVYIDQEGNLVAEQEYGQTVFAKPLTYQDSIDNQVESAYKLENKTVKFALGDYDKSKDLVIDPVVLVYSTYFGGSGMDVAVKMSIDASGNAYMAGYTASADFPTSSPYQGANGGGSFDGFITKINQTGTAIVYSTYIGGSDLDRAWGVDVDLDENVYVSGHTASTNFPLVNAIDATYNGGVQDGFALKLDSSGSSLDYSTYLGGIGSDDGTNITVDDTGAAYVSGFAYSADFPTVNPIQTYGGGYDVFISKIAPDGSSLVYSTFLGGSVDEQSSAIIVDQDHNAYVVGFTTSSDFPTSSPYQAALSGSEDGFVTGINSTGSAWIYSTYLGGTGIDDARGVALDSSGNIFVTGRTNSTNFPTASPYQAANAGGYDNFVTKFNPSVSSIIFSTYIGGSGDEDNYHSAINQNDEIYITGLTGSTDYPTLSAYQDTYGGGSTDAYVTKFNTAGSDLVYSTYIGGSGDEAGDQIEIRLDGDAYLAGYTTSTDFPTVSPYQAANAGSYDAFMLQLTEHSVIVTGQVNPTLTFTVDDTVCELGPVTASTTGTCIHTMTAGTNASNGYAISYLPTSTLTSGSNTITETGVTGATSSQGSEQFGLNLKDNSLPDIGAEASGGIGAASANYNNANTFSFTTGGAQVAESSTLSDTTTFTVSYIANVANTTEAGNYSTTQTYNIVASY